MSDATELKEQLQKALAALEEVSKKNTALESENKALRAESDGWLVTTPSPMYDGITLGVQFHNGAAFIRKNAEFVQMKRKPAKASSLEKYSTEERKAIREREKTPTSDLLIQQLTTDFGYTATWYTEAEARKLQDVLQNRAVERRLLEDEIKKRGDGPIRALATPHHIGG